MSMNNANSLLGPCELLRQLNDLFQSDDAFDCLMRGKLALIEDMIKHMSIELNKFVPDYQKIWKSNPTFEADMKRRKSKNYKYGV